MQRVGLALQHDDANGPLAAVGPRGVDLDEGPRAGPSGRGEAPHLVRAGVLPLHVELDDPAERLAGNGSLPQPVIGIEFHRDAVETAAVEGPAQGHAGDPVGIVRVGRDLDVLVLAGDCRRVPEPPVGRPGILLGGRVPRTRGAVPLRLLENNGPRQLVVVKLEAKLGGAGKPLGPEGNPVGHPGSHLPGGSPTGQARLDQVVEVIHAGSRHHAQDPLALVRHRPGILVRPEHQPPGRATESPVRDQLPVRSTRVLHHRNVIEQDPSRVEQSQPQFVEIEDSRRIGRVAGPHREFVLMPLRGLRVVAGPPRGGDRVVDQRVPQLEAGAPAVGIFRPGESVPVIDPVGRTAVLIEQEELFTPVRERPREVPHHRDTRKLRREPPRIPRDHQVAPFRDQGPFRNLKPDRPGQSPPSHPHRKVGRVMQFDPLLVARFVEDLRGPGIGIGRAVIIHDLVDHHRTHRRFRVALARGHRDPGPRGIQLVTSIGQAGPAEVVGAHRI